MKKLQLSTNGNMKKLFIIFTKENKRNQNKLVIMTRWLKLPVQQFPSKRQTYDEHKFWVPTTLYNFLFLQTATNEEELKKIHIR